MKCTKHENQYSNTDDNLYQESKHFVLYTESGEFVYEIPVFARRTVGNCKCLQRLDGTKFFIWNLGQGRFVDYTVLLDYLHKWVQSGLTIYALWKSYRTKALTCGLSFTLTYNDLHRSMTGFMNNLDMDFKKAFTCPTHGNSPVWVVSDGKRLGPLKRHVDRVFLN